MTRADGRRRFSALGCRCVGVRRRLALLPAGAIVVNVGRGALVSDVALVEA